MIGNLVHSSAPIKKKVLEEGALQPVINLLSSSCTDSQREAALLLGQFATGAQRAGAAQRRRGMAWDLGCADALLRTTPLSIGPTCRLLRRAAEGDYKHKIVQRGAVPPLIDMLGNDDNQLREMAAFALGRLAQNADNQVGVGRLAQCGVGVGAWSRLVRCLWWAWMSACLLPITLTA